MRVRRRHGRQNLGPLTIDAQGPTDVCRDYAPSPGTSGDKTTTTKVSLPAGQYRPLPTGAFRWFVNRTAAAGDGETHWWLCEGRDHPVEIFGAESVASTWARAADEHNDGAGLPYNQDFSTFSADGNATFYLKPTARADACSRARLLDAAIEPRAGQLIPSERFAAGACSFPWERSAGCGGGPSTLFLLGRGQDRVDRG